MTVFAKNTRFDSRSAKCTFCKSLHPYNLNSGPGHHIRSPEDDISIAIGRDNRVAAYTHNDENRFAFSSHIFASSTNVDLRYDLIDCHISLCSPEVLMRFTDEFDYQTMADLIQGRLMDESLSRIKAVYEVE